jgi:hypothetical protein
MKFLTHKIWFHVGPHKIIFFYFFWWIWLSSHVQSNFSRDYIFFWHVIILCFYCVIENFQSVKGWLLYKDAIKCFESKISSSACVYWYHIPLPSCHLIFPYFSKTVNFQSSECGGGGRPFETARFDFCLFSLVSSTVKIHPRVVRSDVKQMSKHVQLATEHYATVVLVACECRCSIP